MTNADFINLYVLSAGKVWVLTKGGKELVLENHIHLGVIIDGSIILWRP
ncbi:MAG: hypothetical protein L0J28_05625 [Staphylococcus simulans]|nr:hypothetical protein HMPREF3215_02297 [Staphylococcus simulans]MDN6232502.1 hypothetical protein [Staphylococcus simulans]